MPKPLLTIGMIFRDDIRCIERCLKALEPLRKAIPCQLIMADTGSVDGSRQVAEQYADVLFDFTWVKDFSAARNAVMDKAEGKWYFSVDTDEYLDEDVSQLVGFLKGNNRRFQAAAVIQRNYRTYEMDGDFRNFNAVRLLRMSTGIRFQGPIHEHWAAKPGGRLDGMLLSRTVLHHDGYVGFSDKRGIEKRKRNMELLQAEAEKRPDDLLVRLQLIESGNTDPNILTLVRDGADLVLEKKTGWKVIGPPILRYAVLFNNDHNLPKEAQEWIEKAEEMFPDSLFTRVDVKYTSCLMRWNAKEYARCIEEGEAYLRGMADLKANKDPSATMVSELCMSAPSSESRVRLMMAEACEEENWREEALNHLKEVDPSALGQLDIGRVLSTLLNIHIRTQLDTEAVLNVLWERINAPKPSREQADQRVQMFRQIAAPAFSRKKCVEESQIEDISRFGWTLFLPLEGSHMTGTWAAVLKETDPVVLEEKLSTVEDWSVFPAHVLAHALNCGVDFPLPGKPLSQETMDKLASHMSEDWNSLCDMVQAVAAESFSGNWQDLAWACSLASAAVRTCAWRVPEVSIPGSEVNMAVTDSGAKRKLALAQSFIRIEAAFLTRCYTPEALKTENLFILPPMHRFGWNCVQAFAWLKKGDVGGYTYFLRAAISACPGQEAMAEFLISNAPHS